MDPTEEVQEQQQPKIHYTNHNGILGHMFVIGIGGESFAFTIEDNLFRLFKTMVETDPETGQEVNPAHFDMDAIAYANPLPPDFKGEVNPRMVVTMKDFKDALKSERDFMGNYVREQLEDVTGGGGSSTSDPTSPTNPVSGMLQPAMFTVDMLVPELTQILGTLPAQSFIDRIVLETHTNFTLLDGTEDAWQFSIGTADPTEAELIIPKTPITKLNEQRAWVVDVQRTFANPTAMVFYIYNITEENPNPLPGPVEPEEPDPDGDFVQAVYLNHGEVTYGLTSDASKKVWNLTVQSDDALPGFNQPDLFGEIGDAQLIDVGVNLPFKPGHRYRVLQQNPALEHFSADPSVEEVEGVWTKFATYEWNPEDPKEDCIYYFCMKPSAGEIDYLHLFIYDLDGETPEQVCRTYHVRNLVTFREIIAPPPPVMDSFVQFARASTPDIDVHIESDTETECSIIVSGSTASANISHPELFGDLDGANGIDIEINLPIEIGATVLVTQINKALEIFKDDPSVSSSEDQTAWIKQKQYTREDDGEEFIYCFALTERVDEEEYVHIAIFNEGEEAPFKTYTIKNEIYFATPEIPRTFAMRRAAVMALSDETEGESGEKVSTSTGKDEGACRIRILSF